MSTSPSADHDLLLGVLALRRDLVSHEQLLTGLQVWVQDTGRGLAQVLADQGALASDDRASLERLAGEQLAAVAARAGTPSIDLASPTTAERLGSQGALPAIPPSTRYRALRLHARGGLGQVSLAVDEELKREVALKEIQPHHADDASQARFLREAEITGRLEHPGIVPVYGLDRDEQGRPRYAMRFIHGDSMQEAITRFHDSDQSRRDPTERALALRGLLRRFVDVCNAVAYAHNRGVIHRDLKPANVMLGDFGETLVVDWGLARVLEQDEEQTQPHRAIQTELGGGSTPTEQGQVIGTPAFMAPEQASGEHDRVGVRSDVFALGATLYCLLTGQAPYRGKHDEVLARARRGEVAPARQVNARVPPALEAVCAKALAGRPEARYGTPRELAGEVERWLADEPVLAHREPLTARLGRWTRRHRTLVTAGVALVLASVVGLALGLAVVGAEQAKTARALAQSEANLKLAQKAVDECFGLARSHPLLQAENLRKVRKLLLEKTLPYYQNFRSQRAGDRVLAAQQAEYLFRAAEITSEIDRKAEAQKGYAEARDVYLELATAHPAVAEYQAGLARSWNNLGMMQNDTGKQAEAQASYERARDLFRELAAAHPEMEAYQADLARTWNNLSALQSVTGKRAEAQQSIEQARDIFQKLARARPREADYQDALALTWRNLGILHREGGRRQEAQGCFEQARDVLRKLARAHPAVTGYRADLAGAWKCLADLQDDAGKHGEALASYQQGLDVWLDLTRAHPEVTRYQDDLARTWTSVGMLHATTGKKDEARKCHEQARAIRHRLATGHPEVPRYRSELASSWNSLGGLQRDAGKHAEAQESFEQARDVYQELARAHPEVTLYQFALANTLHRLGATQDRAGKQAEAQASLEQARDIHRNLVRADPQVPRHQAELAGVLHSLGDLRSATGKQRAARKTYDETRAIYQKLARAHPEVVQYQADLAQTWHSIGMLQSETGEPDGAEKSYEQARGILQRLVQAHPDVTAYAVDLARAWHSLAALQSNAGKATEAEASFGHALDIKQRLARAHPAVPDYQSSLANTWHQLAMHQSATQKPVAARASYERARDIQEQLVKTHPKVVQYQANLANTWNNLGALHYATGKPAEARRCFEEAKIIQENLAKAHPQNTRYQIDLAGTCCNLGHLVDAGKPLEGLPLFTRAIEMLQAVRQQEPDNQTARLFLRNSFEGRAGVLSLLGRYRETIADLDQAIRLDSGPARNSYRLARALALAHAGDHAAAAGQAEQLAALDDLPGGVLYNLACALALSAKAASSQATRPLPEREKIAGQYAGRAVALLERARQGGFFKNRAAVEQMKKDADLAFLRDRADFRRLLAGIEGQP